MRAHKFQPFCFYRIYNNFKCFKNHSADIYFTFRLSLSLLPSRSGSSSLPFSECPPIFFSKDRDDSIVDNIRKTYTMPYQFKGANLQTFFFHKFFSVIVYPTLKNFFLFVCVFVVCSFECLQIGHINEWKFGNALVLHIIF